MDAVNPGFWLSWALVAVSLFNTILLLWLGMTLWLNAERRREFGLALTAAGFLLGGAFFVSHSALLLSNDLALSRSNTLWIAVGMLPVVLLPFVWYVVLLWSNGFWSDPASRLHRRHRYYLWLTGATLVVGFACLVLLGTPYVPLARRLTDAIWPWREWVKTVAFGVPIVALGYTLYVLMCVILSLDVLRQPARTERLMGDMARARARPWLMAASILLVLVGVLVAAVIVWTITYTGSGGVFHLTRPALIVIARFDLAISLLIAAVAILLGQAITAYELFTGKTLPRQGLARQWRRAVLLAGSYGALMGGALVWGLEPVVAVLLTALLMTAFFALLSWRANVEWEQAMQHLRPFVTSQRWYDALIDARAEAPSLAAPFQALCSGLLRTTVAYLTPAGPTAAFVNPLSYPSAAPAPALAALTQQELQASDLILAVDPVAYGGAAWAVPLWREQGLIGVLLFGPRVGNGLYTREEIEIARAAGERLIDAAAGVALSGRLMQLQRQRMRATQVLDQRTRRVLHDEVLPLVHTAMLALSAGQPAEAVIRQLGEAHQEISRLLHELPSTALPEIDRLGLLGALRKMTEVEFAGVFDAIVWRSDEEAAEQAARLQPLAAETLYYAARELVRNAARHARPPAPGQRLRLEIAATASAGQFLLTVTDNGSGMEREPETGHGLALHSTLMAIVGGSLALESIPGQMTSGELALPLG